MKNEFRDYIETYEFEVKGFITIEAKNQDEAFEKLDDMFDDYELIDYKKIK